MGFSNFPVNVSLKPINFFLSFMRRCEDMGWVLGLAGGEEHQRVAGDTGGEEHK